MQGVLRMRSTRLRKALAYQGYHLAVYALVGALLYVAVRACPEGQGKAWGATTGHLIALSWLFVGLMQLWIAAGWRLELHFGALHAWFGRSAFGVFRAGFVLFAVPRLALLVPIAASSPGTLAMPLPLRVALVVVTTPFILWGVYSFVRYFGVDRIFGADHFDPAYRSASLETRGIFAYVGNAGYAVVLTLIYHPALFFDSWLGLLTAAAHHALVWISYFCTEKPDMREIYGGGAREPGAG